MTLCLEDVFREYCSHVTAVNTAVMEPRAPINDLPQAACKYGLSQPPCSVKPP